MESSYSPLSPLMTPSALASNMSCQIPPLLGGFLGGGRGSFKQRGGAEGEARTERGPRRQSRELRDSVGPGLLLLRREEETVAQHVRNSAMPTPPPPVTELGTGLLH